MEPKSRFILLIFAATLLLASGCPPQPIDASKFKKSSSRGDIELSYWVYSDFAQGEALKLQKAFISEFEAMNPGVKINIAGKGDEALTTGQITGAASGSLPDVFMNTTGDGGRLVAVDALKNIHSDWMAMPDSFRDQFDPEVIDVCSPEEGTLYCIPYTGYGSFMFRNLTVLEAAGIDPDEAIEDWDAWLEQMRRITEAGYIAMPDMSLTWWSIVNLYAGVATPEEWGADFEKTRTLLNPDKYAQTVDFMARMKPYTTGLSTWDQGAMDLFISNRLAFYLNGPWAAPQIELAADESGLSYDWVLVPGADVGKHGGVKGYEFLGVAPNANSDIAWKFAAYVLEKDQMSRWAAALGRFNSNAAVLEMPEIASHPLLAITNMATEHALFNKPPFFAGAYPSNYWSAMVDNATAVVDGDMSPQVGAQSLVKELNDILAEN